MSGLGKGQGDLDTVELHHASGASAQVYLLGATLTSYKTPDGIERIFEAIFDGKAIRGGVNLVFPQFGKPSEEIDEEAMALDGIARSSHWSLVRLEEENASSGSTAAVLTLKDDEATRAIWNQAFSLEYVVSLTAASLKMTWSIKITGDAPVNFQTLLHTYFRIPDKVTVPGLEGQTDLEKVTGETVDQIADVELASCTDPVYFRGTAKDVDVTLCHDGDVIALRLKPMERAIRVEAPPKKTIPRGSETPATEEGNRLWVR